VLLVRPQIKAGDVADATLVVRTDYSDQAAWRTVMELLNAPQFGGLEPLNTFVDDPAWDGASVDEVLAVAPDTSDGVVFLADAQTMRVPYPLIAANQLTREDCEDDDEYAYQIEYGREFRVLPAGVSDVSANLSIANMDFPEFAAMAHHDPADPYQGLAAIRNAPQKE
jgi:hypothetical protein